jgi:hypothetical protein
VKRVKTVILVSLALAMILFQSKVLVPSNLLPYRSLLSFACFVLLVYLFLKWRKKEGIDPAIMSKDPADTD